MWLIEGVPAKSVEKDLPVSENIIKHFTPKQGYIQSAGAGLAVDRFLGVEFNICETFINAHTISEFRFAMNCVNVQPVVEGGLWFQLPFKTIESEATQSS